MDREVLSNSKVSFRRGSDKPEKEKDFVERETPYEKVAGQTKKETERLLEKRIDG